MNTNKGYGTKDDILNMRINGKLKRKMVRTARAQGVSLSEFVCQTMAKAV